MASEISITEKATLINSSLKDNWDPGTVTITQGTASISSGVESMTTSEADWTVPTTGGILFVRNIGTTNAALFGPKSGGVMVSMMSLAAGETCRLKLASSVTIRGAAAASTTSCRWTFWRV